VKAPLRAAIVTVSDRSARGEREDRSGPELAEAIRALDGEVLGMSLVPDDVDAIEAELIRLCDERRAPLVLTTGGTGFAPRDVTPEATRRVLEK
jgi:molybdenum cofactor synthesis domain-containing protein